MGHPGSGAPQSYEDSDTRFADDKTATARSLVRRWRRRTHTLASGPNAGTEREYWVPEIDIGAISAILEANLDAADDEVTVYGEEDGAGARHPLNVTAVGELRTVARDGEPEPPTATALYTSSGDNTLITPASGNSILLKWFYAVDAASENPPIVTARFGSNAPFYRVYAVSKKQQFLGGVNEALIVNLSAAGAVAVTAFYEEVA